jgi:putative PIN family toxin of toxin-antitoxin system
MSQNKQLRVVIDTNVLLVSVSSKSKYHWLFEKIVNKDIEIAMTTEILTEYQEIISDKLSPTAAVFIAELFTIAENVLHTTIYYRWNLIPHDPDDNKFVDCYVASGSDYLITNDNDFKALAKNDLFEIKVINIDEFKSLLDER